MICTNCKSGRVANVVGECSDLSVFSIGENEHEGYVPQGLGIGGGDYIRFSYCLECGMIQGDFPISQEVVAEELEDD